MFFRPYYLGVLGPPGSGKTTLIERVLRSNRSRALVAVRFQEAAERDGPGRLPEGNEETRRFREAGAMAELLYRYVRTREHEAGELFGHGSLMRESADAILFEGRERALPTTDFRVYVMRALPPGERLLRWGRKEVARVPLQSYLRARYPELEIPEDAELEMLDEEPEEEVLEEVVLDEEDEELEVLESIEIPDEVGYALLEYVRKGVPVKYEGWMLREGYEELLKAAMVVINVVDEGERSEARAVAEEIRRIWTDEKVAHDVRVTGTWVYGRPPPVCIANLADRGDPEARKVVERIKRALRS